MLKYFLSFLFIIAVSTISYGQQVSFGLRTGVNYSNQLWNFHQYMHPVLGVRGEESSYKGKSKIGFKLGAFADIGLTRFLSFAPGLLYNQKGLDMNLLYYDSDQPPHFFSKSNRVGLHYFSLDAPLKVKVTKQHWSSYLLLGARADALVGYKESLEKNQGLEGYKETYDQLKKVNVGLLTAIGIERELTTKMSLFLEIEYNVARACKEPLITITNSMFALNGGIRWKKN